MSIDADVVGVTKLPDGQVRLTLEQPDPSRTAGQSSLTVVIPPPNIAVLLNRSIWGGADALMCGEIRIGTRIGYTGCSLDANALTEVERTGAGLKKK